LFSAQDDMSNVTQEVGQEVNFFRNYLSSIDWQQVLSSLLVTLIQIIAILIIFWIAKRIGNYFIDATFKRRLDKSASKIPNRKNTLHRLSKNVFNSVAYFFLVFAVLESVGIPVGSLIAGAGIIGLALSLGAQDFVSDIVNGFMILMEKQLDIGDDVEIESVSGTVHDVNLKTTIVKGFDGSINYIPNREITVINNRSRADMRVLIQIRLFPENDLQQIRNVIKQVNDQEIGKYDVITTTPDIIFVPMDDNGQVALQVTMFTEPGEQFGIQMEFYEKYISAITKADIDIPANAIDVADE